MTLIKPPWTDEQVDALCRWQLYGFVHEFTCPNEHGDGVQISMVLIPTRDGWSCPACDYTQDWAHDFMFEPQVDPMDAVARGQLPIWTVYDHPTDYPDKFVARMSLVGKGLMQPTNTNNLIVADDLETLRTILLVEMHLTRIARSPADDPKIVETWI